MSGAEHTTAEPSSAWLRTQVGIVEQSPYPLYNSTEASGQYYALLLGYEDEVSPGVALKVRLPWIFAEVELPAGAIMETNLWGNPEVSAETDLAWNERTRLVMSLGLAFPPGHGGADLEKDYLENKALAIASAGGGWRDRELFERGRVSLTPAMRLEYRPVDNVALEVFFKASLMMRSDRSGSRESDAQHTRINDTGLYAVGGGRAEWNFWKQMSGAVEVWHSHAMQRTIEVPDIEAHRQLVIQPEAFMKISHYSIGASMTLPVGRPLGGSVVTGAVELTVLL